jgi:hypothetical protein
MNKLFLYAAYAIVALSILAWIVSLSGWFLHTALPPGATRGLQIFSFLWIPALIVVAVFRRRVAKAAEG